MELRGLDPLASCMPCKLSDPPARASAALSCELNAPVCLRVPASLSVMAVHLAVRRPSGHSCPPRRRLEDGRYRYIVGVSQPLAEPPHLPPATEQQVRSHAVQLVDLAARRGITHLAFASPGRLRGHVGADRDLFDMFEFQRAATDLLGAEVTVYSDGALANDHVSPDLAAATLL